MYDDRDRAGQGCFLCLESPTQGQYAVLVPCVRPTEAPQVETAYESDEQIYRRLVDTCYRYLGPWKKWLPYYGIDGVLEVNKVGRNRVAYTTQRVQIESHCLV
ncbi:hypothetical protein HYQ44_013712 [Verticillium longisporum]|nr:hypothetical protein HYQ44_013712 [Verticillium longisporum]